MPYVLIEDPDEITGDFTADNVIMHYIDYVDSNGDDDALKFVNSTPYSRVGDHIRRNSKWIRADDVLAVTVGEHTITINGCLYLYKGSTKLKKVFEAMQDWAAINSR
jgi:hypothetical protein